MAENRIEKFFVNKEKNDDEMERLFKAGDMDGVLSVCCATVKKAFDSLGETHRFETENEKIRLIAACEVLIELNRVYHVQTGIPFSTLLRTNLSSFVTLLFNRLILL